MKNPHQTKTGTRPNLLPYISQSDPLKPAKALAFYEQEWEKAGIGHPLPSKLASNNVTRPIFKISRGEQSILALSIANAGQRPETGERRLLLPPALRATQINFHKTKNQITMARISQGILGGFSGKVGTVVGATWRGINYMRSLPGKRTTELTDKQKAQHAKFSLMLGFLTTMKELLLIGYKDHASQMTETNSALSHNMKNAIMGDYPDLEIVFSQIVVTRGSLPNAAVPAATPGAAGVITFNWTNNTGLGKAKATDKAMLIAYCDALKQTVYITGPLRSAATGNLPVPQFSGETVHTWISFITEDGKDVATSLYTGTLSVL